MGFIWIRSYIVIFAVTHGHRDENNEAMRIQLDPVEGQRYESKSGLLEDTVPAMFIWRSLSSLQSRGLRTKSKHTT